MPNRQVGFIDKKERGAALTSDKKWLVKDLLGINNTSLDLLNAFIFLHNKGFIKSKERVSTGARIYVEIQITDTGIDIVEGVERGRDGKQDFETTFNIKVDDGSDVDGLVKDNLSALFD